MTEHDPSDELFPLDQLIGAYLHQDMELVADTVPEAITRYARLNDAETKAALVSAMDRFEQRFHNDLHGEFRRRYVYDFMPEDLGTDVSGFFDMVRVMLANVQST